MVAVSVKGLRKSFGSVRALDDVSFEVEPGQIFALLGPNGAGKTTSIEILEGFTSREGGEVRVLGVDPGDRSELRWLRTKLGIVLQELAVESFFSVRQVLQRNAGFYPSPRSVDEVIELVGLKEKADAKVKSLSGGQQRRLDVGMGIVGNPELLFLDEPTTGLDPAARRATWDLIRKLADEGKTVLLSSHYMDEVEALAQNVAVLARGQLVASGTPSSLGGRDHGRVTIRFVLPRDVATSRLPVPASVLANQMVEIVTDDEVAILARVLNWSLDNGIEIKGLSVARATLEDVYLHLTDSDVDKPGADDA